MNTLKKQNARGRMRIEENVTYQLRDKDGNLKSMFALNKFGRAILEAARKGYSAYNADGSVKDTFRARLALHGLQLSFITGNWVTSMQVSNGVTNAGKALVAGRINGSGAPAAATYVGVGTGTTAFNAADTALEAEAEEDGSADTDHKAASVSLQTTDVTNDTARLIATFNFTNTLAITESGVFNAASDGTLLCRQTFAAINVVDGDSLQVTWDIDVD